MANELSVLIIGLGTRGLGVLERLLAIAAAHPAPVRVQVVDPTCDGTGLHTPAQPDYLLLNTVCGQVTMFPDRAMIGAGPERRGPSLYEWATGRDLRVGADGWTVGEVGRPIRPTDFLPRRVLGEYLRWFLGELVRSAPANVRVTFHRAQVVELVDHLGPGLAFRLSDDTVASVDSVFLTTGHTPNTRPAAPGRVIDALYPLPATLDRVEPGQSVAIGGMGLSAMDALAALTVGRGGTFAGDRRYRPSGREPSVLMFCTSGVPFRARPLVNRPLPGYVPVALTEPTIDRLRHERGPLDFDTDLLPLVLAEMRAAYHRRRATMAGEPDPFANVRTPGEVEVLLNALDTAHGGFDAYAAWTGSEGMALTSGQSYQDWAVDFIRADLAEGVLGFEGSPVKAGIDILRDLRDTIRYAVDFGGLTADSLRSFLAVAVPRMNRAVVGPQHDRHRDLLALVEAGVVSLAAGPAPEVTWLPTDRWRISSTRLAVPFERDVDWLCRAHVPYPAVGSSASPLLVSLREAGLLRSVPGATGVAVDRDQHPIRTDGATERRIRVLGPLCEGSTFYNHLVPSPGAFSRPPADAQRCVAALFGADVVAAGRAS
ncbi:FAD/NAD(P)-binding domain-containing protein [Actinokineospora sp. NBRC 105648]|uniref:FAD/NAD(P)-binding protein n=1 Tax=Actinokineospora sp. NBRC 105648 TaxID=3032206 RepID=UPI0024A32A69|nr:FAD/NAD(P)-binding domain-containing protein [Actinokineospora sp. NBRC 105648]GLZ41100.1 hypothetical protein Acsp05_47240 [Actinokineospora sp. NBRC 105648]